MKKNIKLLIVFISILFIGNVHAASANIGVSANANQIIVGKNVKVTVTISSGVALGAWEYTLNYDSSAFKLISSDVPIHWTASAGNANTYSVSYNYTFQALKSSTTTFYIDSSAVLAFDGEGNYLEVNNGSRKVSSITYAEYQASLSSNNNLKSIIVEGYEVTPEFDKDTLEYSVKVDENVKNINVIAYVEDNSATVIGEGTLEVTAGTNTFDLVVVAQNGAEKTYKLSVEVVDKNPIEVKVNGEKYTVVKIRDVLDPPTGYEETTVNISDFEIPSYYSSITDYTLVGLKDSEGKIGLFIYDNNEYTKYVELNFGNIIIMPVSMDETLEDSFREDITILDSKVEALNIGSDRYYVIKGLNIQTNETGLYLVDIKDSTLIKYDENYLYNMNSKIKLLTIATFSFIITTILMGILLISTNTKKKRKKVKKETEMVDQKVVENTTNNIEDESISEEKEEQQIIEVKTKKKHKKEN